MKRKRIYNNNLRGLREQRGLTLTLVASLIDKSKAHLSNVENGYEKASASLNIKLKEVYKPTEEEWQLYFAYFTKDNNSVLFDSSACENVYKSENTHHKVKVFSFTNGEEVEVGDKGTATYHSTQSYGLWSFKKEEQSK